MAITISEDNFEKYRNLSVKEGLLEYQKLREDVTKEGILDRDYSYYTKLFIFDFVGFFVSIIGFYYSTSISSSVIWALLIAFFTVHIGGLVHDAGHRAITKNASTNDILGYLSSFFIAFPYLVWKVKHNRHHAFTNQENEDPDLDVPIALTKEVYNKSKGLNKYIRKFQYYLFLPMGSFLSFSMRFKSLPLYFQNFKNPLIIDLLLLFPGLIVWYLWPFYFFPLPKALIYFFIVNLVSGSYMLQVFAPNHKGMPQLSKKLDFSFIEHQIRVARNINGGSIYDFFYLGLNYQIEHHLFPNCPRNKLKLITPYVLKLCKKWDLPYVKMGIIQSNLFILKNLKEASSI